MSVTHLGLPPVVTFIKCTSGEVRGRWVGVLPASVLTFALSARKRNAATLVNGGVSKVNET